VIGNELEYRITTAEAKRFAQALAQAEQQAPDLHPRLRQALREGLESQLQELREQLAEYETLRGHQQSAGMRKKQLIEQVASKSNMSPRQVQTIVDATFGAIRDAMAKGEKVTLTGFGSFEVVQRNEREGRNPRTGTKIKIAARKAPQFRAGSELKRALGSS